MYTLNFFLCFHQERYLLRYHVLTAKQPITPAPDR